MVKSKNTENKKERKEELDKEWEMRLPCNNCHDRMKKMCKYYNTFKRPDYPHNIFKVGEITCDDRMDPEPITVPNPFL